MAATEEQIQAYLGQLRSLLPAGRLWTAEPESVIGRILTAVGAVGCDVEQRIRDLLLEADPRTTTEKVEDWEAVLDLPGACKPRPNSLALRRLEIIAKLTSIGGSSVGYFVELALALGFEITIEEHRPFKVGSTTTVGSTVGEALTNEAAGWPYTWTVHAPPVSPEFFRVGESTIGDALAEGTNDRLECLLTELKPAHTIVRFVYDGEPADYLPWSVVAPAPAVIELAAPRVVLGFSDF